MDIHIEGFDAIVSKGGTKIKLTITLTTFDGLCAINSKKLSVDLNCLTGGSQAGALRRLADMIDKHHDEEKRLCALYGRDRQRIQQTLSVLNKIQKT